MIDIKPKILFLSSEFPPGPGGIGNHAYHISKELHRNGAEVVVFANQDYTTFEKVKSFNQSQKITILGEQSIKNRLLKIIKRFSLISRLLREWSPHVIIASGSRMSWLALLISFLYQIPWVVIGHGSEFGEPLTYDKRITRFAFNNADAVIFVSNYTKRVANMIGINNRNEYTITNGADNEIFAPDPYFDKTSFLKLFNIPIDSRVLATVGSVTERKGQEIVIRAMPKVLEKIPDVHYFMAGYPLIMDRLEQLAKELQVSEHIHFLGIINNNELVELYHACEFFIMVSQNIEGDFEGFGISVLEAALCGKPAIVSRESGLSEAVVDQITGICVPEKDPLATAEAIIKLLHNPDELKTMAKNAELRACAGFTWNIVGKKYYEVIQKTVDYQIKQI